MNYEEENNYEEEYGEYEVEWVKILQPEDRKLLHKVKDVLNTNLTGEEYIQFNTFLDKLENEFEENQGQQEIFDETKSSGLDVLKGGKSCAWNSYYNQITQATDLYRSWRKDGYHEKSLFHEEIEVPNSRDTGSKAEWIPIKDDTYEKASKRIRTYILKKHKVNNENPLYDIGKSLTLFRDYWGNWKSFQGRLKPIDVASYMTQVCSLIGEYLSNTRDQGIGGYDSYDNPRYKVPEISDWEIDGFIRRWNKDESRDCKFPTKPKEEKQSLTKEDK